VRFVRRLLVLQAKRRRVNSVSPAASHTHTHMHLQVL
jgi:hypothetical protein